jgi:hypothetical protein
MKPATISNSKLVCAVSVLLIILTVIAFVSHMLSRCECKCEYIEEDE